MKEKWVWNLRTAIYVVGILGFIVSVAVASPHGEAQDPEPEKEEFWPPDMVPHPHPPGSGPSGPGEPEMA